MTSQKDWFGLAQPVAESDWDLLDVIIGGVPFDGAAGEVAGASLAPEKLRALARVGWPVTESGELIDRIRLVDVGDLRIGHDRNAFRRFMTARVAAFPRTAFMLFLGGNHSISIPLIEAFGAREKGSCGVLFLDAHPDLWDVYEQDPFGHVCVLRRILEFSFLSPKKVVLVGVRSFSPGEIDLLQRQNIFCLNARDFQLRGPERCAQQVVETFYELDSVYLSLDIDVLDPVYAPGTSLPAPGGPTARELLSFLRVVFGKLKIAAMDLVEISPPLDSADLTARLGARIVLEVLGFLQARKGRLSL